MSYVIRVNKTGMNVSLYLESSIQDSIVLTSKKEKAKKFKSKKDAEVEIAVRNSWAGKGTPFFIDQGLEVEEFIEQEEEQEVKEK